MVPINSSLDNNGVKQASITCYFYSYAASISQLKANTQQSTIRIIKLENNEVNIGAD